MKEFKFTKYLNSFAQNLRMENMSTFGSRYTNSNQWVMNEAKRNNEEIIDWVISNKRKQNNEFYILGNAIYFTKSSIYIHENFIEMGFLSITRIETKDISLKIIKDNKWEIEIELASVDEEKHLMIGMGSNAVAVRRVYEKFLLTN